MSDEQRITLTVRRGPLAGPVLTRLVAMAGSRSELPVDRLDDALLIAEALTSDGAAFGPDGRLSVEACSRDGVLELRVGPLAAGDANRLLDAGNLPGAGAVIARLATGALAEPSGDAQRVLVRIAA
ncbi:unannotated protein [freshwater metagenome]|uniref:Unannotated protein n=1 Tax=freshwater metagenome TaxID=449393 RepID=A0A6J7DDB0_9ZZZZ|nr:hypothetical protein [Actinomycetota bacterium]